MLLLAPFFPGPKLFAENSDNLFRIKFSTLHYWHCSASQNFNHYDGTILVNVHRNDMKTHII